jgi:hypothetical protein
VPYTFTLCDKLAAAEETVDYQAHNTITQYNTIIHNTMHRQQNPIVKINAWFAQRTKKQPTKYAVELRIKIIAAHHIHAIFHGLLSSPISLF